MQVLWWKIFSSGSHDSSFPRLRGRDLPSLPYNHKFSEASKFMPGLKSRLCFRNPVSLRKCLLFEPRFSICKQHYCDNATAKVMWGKYQCLVDYSYSIGDNLFLWGEEVVFWSSLSHLLKRNLKNGLLYVEILTLNVSSGKQ